MPSAEPSAHQLRLELACGLRRRPTSSLPTPSSSCRDHHLLVTARHAVTSHHIADGADAERERVVAAVAAGDHHHHLLGNARHAATSNRKADGADAMRACVRVCVCVCALLNVHH